MLIYIVYFILIAVMAIEYELKPFQSKIPLVIITLLLVGMAGFRSPEVSRDYETYQMNFEIIKNLNDPLFLTLMEPGFIAIVYVIRIFSEQNYAMLIMLFYALCAVSLKVKSIRMLSINPYLVILFYFSHYFILHEMIQIRIGLASAIFLYSLTYYLKGNRRSFILLILLATLFHYSAIFYLLILVFDVRILNRYLYSAILAFTILLAYVRLPLASLLSKFDSSTISPKLDTYVELGQRGLLDDVNVFNSITLINFFCCSYLLYLVPKPILLSDKRLVLFLKCNILSLFMLALLSGVPSVAFRFSELFGIVSMFLFAYLAKFLPAMKANIFICILLAGLIFYIIGFYGSGLLGEYRMVNIK
ncbi:hypothetical protein BH11BAC3_BH11BAC3_01200 [soil metagenome]